MTKAVETLRSELAACTLCAGRFRATKTQHRPKPIVWFRNGARILIASQAPGARAHEKGEPFRDPSGVRLRDWLGVDEDTFYDQTKFAIVPMGFCFPGYDAAGSDLPPPKICAATWRGRILSQLTAIRLTLLIGGYAQKWHLGKEAAGGVTATVQGWNDLAPDILPLPHPSWRNTAWLKKNPWFETDLLPVLRTRVQELIA